MNLGDVYTVNTIGGTEVPVLVLSAAAAGIAGAGVTVVTLADPDIAPDTVLTVRISAVGLVARCYDIRTIPAKRFADLVGRCTTDELAHVRAAVAAYLDL
ncbi:type II toxin-antitoxin system PemK/MazF family toxin [Actinomadura harenae]|uniref:Type II toxin-antitoxin system PemK/MazF family toxin n=1 Tax=Actinomadura harenae TaxID=2483351 RepID=A0A3M2M7Y2_9ACTN|nr:type II toxin-antitoxin system PemK/MazF family toxin [Actinomadura harenae]RMI44953.1 hypothetical protein EBO15_11835 [Actinomadura harenae]